jgi:hypothetical protein
MKTTRSLRAASDFLWLAAWLAPFLVPPQLHLELIREKEAADEREAKLKQLVHKLEEERKDLGFINAHLSRCPRQTHPKQPRPLPQPSGWPRFSF